MTQIGSQEGMYLVNSTCAFARIASMAASRELANEVAQEPHEEAREARAMQAASSIASVFEQRA